MSARQGRYRIGKRFRFEAAHQLSGLPEDHKCRRLHGHSYAVEFVLAGDRLSTPGFVTDFGDLDVVRRYLADHLDHRVLNDVLPVEPTSENLARFLAEWFAEHVEPHVGGRLERVRVSETESTWAEYEPVEEARP
ncbi:6-carboxytetrahydropterin synthase QueD [Streptomyces sp. 4N509B]|uniref:6-carboxytetrahydropterin synthase QueD n=1 Tax=Streptomyces sp. 4N509B TaxID=3457413 RepID=UPI003FD30318